MHHFFTTYFWKNIHNVFEIWVYSFGFIPFIFVYHFLVPQKIEKSKFKESLKSSFIFILIFIPAVLFIVHIFSKVIENTNNLNF